MMNNTENTKKNTIREMIHEIISRIESLAESASYEYALGKVNAENTDNEAEKIAENYRADMNEGKLFAYDEVISILKQYLK